MTKSSDVDAKIEGLKAAKPILEGTATITSLRAAFLQLAPAGRMVVVRELVESGDALLVGLGQGLDGIDPDRNAGQIPLRSRVGRSG